MDTIFDGADLSNKRFDFQRFERVTFKNCKMVGTSFIDASMRDVVMINCTTKYLNFAGAVLENVEIRDCDFSEAEFLEVKMSNVILSGVKFSNAKFIESNLKGVDFSESILDATGFDFESISGIKVASFQCEKLVSMLGVEVKN